MAPPDGRQRSGIPGKGGDPGPVRPWAGRGVPPRGGDRARLAGRWGKCESSGRGGRSLTGWGGASVRPTRGSGGVPPRRPPAPQRATLLLGLPPRARCPLDGRRLPSSRRARNVGDLGLPVEAGAEGEDDGFGEAEYAAINSMLDQINSCLDHLEEKNDHLHARLQELLESNRQTRLEFQQQLGEAPPDASP